MLAGGLALVIPAVVLSLDATRFRPEEGATEEQELCPSGPPWPSLACPAAAS